MGSTIHPPPRPAPFNLHTRILKNIVLEDDEIDVSDLDEAFVDSQKVMLYLGMDRKSSYEAFSKVSFEDGKLGKAPNKTLEAWPPKMTFGIHYAQSKGKKCCHKMQRDGCTMAMKLLVEEATTTSNGHVYIASGAPLEE